MRDWTLSGSFQSSGISLSSRAFSVPYHITIILTIYIFHPFQHITAETQQGKVSDLS